MIMSEAGLVLPVSGDKRTRWAFVQAASSIGKITMENSAAYAFW